MTIFAFRSGFLRVIIAALVITTLISPNLPTGIVCALIAALAVFTATRTEHGTGMILGGLALATAAVAGASAAATITTALWLRLAAAAGAALLAAGWLVWCWNARLPVRYGQQVNLSGLFGIKAINGPTRIRRPSGWFGGITSIISLREMKSELHVAEIDTRAAPAPPYLRMVSAPEGDGPAPSGPTPKIHSLDLSATFSIDGKQWYLLNNIPQAASRKRQLAPEFSGPLPPHEQPAFWEALVTEFVRQEVPEVLRKVIHREGWSAADVSERREAVAAALLAQLQSEGTGYGIIFTSVELFTVAAESPQAMREARNTALRAEGRAEEVKRLGAALIDVNGAFLERVQQLLRSRGLSATEVEAITRNQLLDLMISLRRYGNLDLFLEQYSAHQNDPQQRHAA